MFCNYMPHAKILGSLQIPKHSCFETFGSAFSGDSFDIVSMCEIPRIDCISSSDFLRCSVPLNAMKEFKKSLVNN